MVAFRKHLEPELCTFIDAQQNVLTIEVVLPGVDKETIKLRVNSRCLLLYAASDDVDYSKYVAFAAPVVATRAHAKFEHGLLRVTVPMRA